MESERRSGSRQDGTLRADIGGGGDRELAAYQPGRPRPARPSRCVTTTPRYASGKACGRQGSARMAI